MNDKVEKRSVSAPKELFEAAEKRRAARMMSNFSEYVRALIREDVSGKLQTRPAEKEAA